MTDAVLNSLCRDIPEFDEEIDLAAGRLGSIKLRQSRAESILASHGHNVGIIASAMNMIDKTFRDGRRSDEKHRAQRRGDKARFRRESISAIEDSVPSNPSFSECDDIAQRCIDRSKILCDLRADVAKYDRQFRQERYFKSCVEPGITWAFLTDPTLDRVHPDAYYACRQHFVSLLLDPLKQSKASTSQPARYQVDGQATAGPSMPVSGQMEAAKEKIREFNFLVKAKPEFAPLEVYMHATTEQSEEVWQREVQPKVQQILTSRMTNHTDRAEDPARILQVVRNAYFAQRSFENVPASHFDSKLQQSRSRQPLRYERTSRGTSVLLK